MVTISKPYHRNQLAVEIPEYAPPHMFYVGCNTVLFFKLMLTL